MSRGMLQCGPRRQSGFRIQDSRLYLSDGTEVMGHGSVLAPSDFSCELVRRDHQSSYQATEFDLLHHVAGYLEQSLMHRQGSLGRIILAAFLARLDLRIEAMARSSST